MKTARESGARGPPRRRRQQAIEHRAPWRIHPTHRCRQRARQKGAIVATNISEQPRLLLTIQEAAARLSVSRSHLYATYITPGILPIVHIGRSVRVVASSLDALV